MDYEIVEADHETNMAYAGGQGIVGRGDPDSQASGDESDRGGRRR